jgi:ankyrin repeat protein
MRKHKPDTLTTLSFFFNARGHPLEQTTQGMYRSLLHQVYTKFPQRLPDQLPKSSYDWKVQGWPLPVLQEMLREALLEFSKTRSFVCYIDALDECAEETIRLAIQYFEELGDLSSKRGVGFSICFASRHYPRISIRYCEQINLDTRSEHQNDISRFVLKTLRGADLLRKELGREISTRSSGVFLWAALVVQMMNASMDRGAIRSELLVELDAVPSGVEALLQNVLLDQDESLLLALQWVLCSKKPLTLPQLYFAIKVSARCLTTAVWDETEVGHAQMDSFVLNASRGLIEFTAGPDPSAQFIHESVREYLLHIGLATMDTSLEGNVIGLVHARLAAWCQDYVELDVGQHLGAGVELELRGLSDTLNSKEHIVYNAYHTVAYPLRKRFPLMEYALNSLFHHVETAYATKVLPWQHLETLPWSTWVLLKTAMGPHMYYSPTWVYILLEQHCEGLVKAILQHHVPGKKAVQSSEARNIAIDSAAQAEIFRLEVNAQCGGMYSTALQAAVQARYTGVVRMLLERGADPNLAGGTNNVPLFAALSTGNARMAKLLLQYKADPNAESHVDIGNARDSLVRYTVLYQATEQRHREIMRLLLANGARADLAWKSREAMLDMLSGLLPDCIGVARLLLADGQNLGGELLCRAVARRRSRTIRLLLDAGADPNLGDGQNHTPLQYAALLRSARTVRSLLKAGADASVRDPYLGTALHIVIRREGMSMTERAVGPVSVHHENGPSYRAIATALLDAGADIRATDGRSQSAMALAMHYKLYDLVMLLRARTPDIKDGDSDGIHDSDSSMTTCVNIKPSLRA